MSGTTNSIAHQLQPHRDVQGATNTIFLRYLPAVNKHAAVKFRNLSAVDREEAIAEAMSAAFVNVHNSLRNGRASKLTPSSLADYAVLHVCFGKHVGGSRDGANDVLSPRARSRHGFRLLGLPWDSPHAYDCVTDPAEPVWRNRLLENRRTNVADLAAFRMDWSEFLGRQHDRTRRAMAMLAAGHRQVEVAEELRVTPAAICQRIKKAEREWLTWQGIDPGDGQIRYSDRQEPRHRPCRVAQALDRRARVP
jgi:hypothetical protein